MVPAEIALIHERINKYSLVRTERAALQILMALLMQACTAAVWEAHGDIW